MKGGGKAEGMAALAGIMADASDWEPGVKWGKYYADDMFKEAIQTAGWEAGVTNQQSSVNCPVETLCLK